MKSVRSVLGLFVVACLAGSVSLAQDQEATAIVTPRSISPQSGTNPNAGGSKLPPLSVTVELMGGSKIVGTLVDVVQLPMKTSFGEASVPLAEVAGVKFASADDSSTTVILKNGDSITGATDLKVISVDTEWGSAKINATSIASILLLPDLRWNASNGLSGRRWSLVDAKQANAPPSSPLNASPAPRSANGSSINSPVTLPRANP